MLVHDTLNHMLRVYKTNNVLIEYTTNCNLRCSYCSVSQPDWPGMDLDQNLADEITQAVIKRSPQYAVIHGHGETTIVKGWERHAKAFFDAGISVNICSNLAKTYTDEEITTLSRLRRLTVSIDTIDPELFRKLRRGGNVEKVLSNLSRIQTEARGRGKEISVGFSIVCSDKSVWGLYDLVKRGTEMGVLAFTFCNLGVLATPEGGLETKHVSEMSVYDCHKILKMFAEIKMLCEQNNRIFDMKSGIVDTIRAKINDK